MLVLENVSKVFGGKSAVDLIGRVDVLTNVMMGRINSMSMARALFKVYITCKAELVAIIDFVSERLHGSLIQ